MQALAQGLVEPQGLRLVGMHQHQRAIALLVQRIERQHLLGGLGRDAERLGGKRIGHHAGEGALAQLAQPLPLHELPFLERRVRDHQVVQKGPAIERGRLDQAVERVLAGQALQFGGVDLDRAAVERDRLPVRLQDRLAAGYQRPPQPHQRLFQAVARLVAIMFAPQQAGEAVARLRLAGSDGEEGEQGAILGGAQLHCATGILQLEPAEQRQPQFRHDQPRRIWPPAALLAPPRRRVASFSRGIQPDDAARRLLVGNGVLVRNEPQGGAVDRNRIRDVAGALSIGTPRIREDNRCLQACVRRRFTTAGDAPWTIREN